MKRVKPKQKDLSDTTQRFPRKVTIGKSKKQGRATRKHRRHAMK